VSSIQLLRHATVVVELDGQRILVDPMLDAAGVRPPIQNTPEPRDNPLVELPAEAGAALQGLTGAIVTHLHADHLDDEGAQLLASAGIPVQGQAGDLETLAGRSITATEIGSAPFGPVQVHRTGGRHAHEAGLSEALGQVSGAVLEAGGERIYLGGDTVPGPELEAAIAEHRPTAIVLNAGGARFLDSGPIISTSQDVVDLARRLPQTTIVAVHLDSINHCLETREHLRAALAEAGVDNVVVPEDGETVSLSAAS
jgi:L-ascorbate metabolism protein UlaG (beta-lactamase superfamily)